MAIYKDRSDVHAPWDPSDPGRAMVRGSLPLELREWQQQTGRSLGTLILGPDGEVIQMSLLDPTNMAATEDQPALASVLDQVTPDHALQVLASERKLPWILLMPTEHKATGEASDPEGPPANMEQCELVQAVASDGQTVLSGDQQGPESSRNRTKQHQDTQRPGGRHKDMAAVSYNLCSRTAARQEEGKEAWEGKEVRREEAEEKSTTRKRSQDRDQPGPPMSGVSSLLTTEEEESQNINPHKPSHPTPTGHSTEWAVSQKGNPKHSDGALPPSGRKGGPSKKTNVMVGEQNPQQVEGETQETGEQTSREKLEDTLNKEVESQDSPAVQTMKNRKVNEGQEGRGQEQKGLSKEKGRGQEQKGLSKEKGRGQEQKGLPKEEGRGQEQKGLPKEKGRVLRKKKKDRVKDQAEFVVGKPKGHVDVERTQKTKERKGTSETSPDGDTVDDSAALNINTHDFESMVEEEHSVHMESPRPHHSSGNRSSSSNGQSGQISHRSNSCEEVVLPSGPRRSSHDQLSPCSVVMTAENQLLNLVMSDASSNTDKNRAEAAARKEQQKKVLAEKAERRRLEVERKRKERDEEKRRQQEREEREECMRLELEEEQNQRAEELRLRRLSEEEERRRLEEKETERIRREQAEKEREWRKKEKKRSQLEMIQKIRQEEEERRAAELEQQRLEEALRKEEERRRLAAMEDHEKTEYLQKQKEEEEERRKAEEERKRRVAEATQRAKEEARLQAELFARQRAVLEQQLQFRRGLLMEAGALGQTQDISRAWVYSYFELLQLLGLAEAPSAQEDLPKDMS
ncbi:trichohyalin-like [Coregonus clupeaformis]|uniref:trichohyalin-like n=1 Tax=Coregonus clupeaformis TaxID=59861 RepID=UPI001BE12215|nr:trichohyalin-like [Coregonus clupeaformis]